MSLFLYLVRHAQSADKQSGQSDHDRTLTPHGKTQSAHLGKYFSEQHYFFDRILCSTATRARQTLDQLLSSAAESYHKRTLFNSDLYSGNRSTYSAYIHQQDQSIRHLLIVGHNPSITQVVEEFCPNFTESFHPGGFILIEFECDQWHSAIANGKIINILNNS